MKWLRLTDFCVSELASTENAVGISHILSKLIFWAIHSISVLENEVQTASISISNSKIAASPWWWVI